MCGMIITRMETYNLSHMHKYENCKQNSYIYIYIYIYISPYPSSSYFRRWKLIFIPKTINIIYHLKNKIEKTYDLLQRQRKHFINFNNNLW